MSNFKEDFTELVNIYKNNLDSNSVRTNISIATRLKNGKTLVLNRTQKSISDKLTHDLTKEYTTRKNNDFSLEHIANVVMEYIKKIFDDELLVDKAYKAMIQELDSSRPQKFTFLIPAMLVIDPNIEEPINIGGLKLIADPIKYLTNVTKWQFWDESGANKVFEQKAPYNECSPVGAMGEVEATNIESARLEFRKLVQQANGVLKLFFPQYNAYFFQSDYSVRESWFYTLNTDLQVAESYHNINFALVCITLKEYMEFKKLILWLNTEEGDNDYKIKVQKMKDAFFWYNCAIEELDITKRYLYLITVLETLLKKNIETTEAAAKIADRVTFLLCLTPESREEVYEKVKRIYTKRGNLVHRGATLDITDQSLVNDTEGYVRDVMLHALKNLQSAKTFDDFIKDIDRVKFGYRVSEVD